MSNDALSNPETALALSEEMRNLLADMPVVSSEDMTFLHSAAEDLENDPEFQAGCLKGHFVTAILDAMHVCNVSKSQLASQWGRTRQYLSKILNESNRANFTIDTMVELAMLLNRRLKIEVVEIEANISFTNYQIPEGSKKPVFASPFTRPLSNSTAPFNEYRLTGDCCEAGARSDAAGMVDSRTALSA